MLHYTVYSRNNHQEMEIAKKIICNVKGNYKFIMCRLNEKYIDPMWRNLEGHKNKYAQMKKHCLFLDKT